MSPEPGRAVVPLLMSESFLCYVNHVRIATGGVTQIMEQYGLSPTGMTMAYSAFLISYTCGMIPAACSSTASALTRSC